MPAAHRGDAIGDSARMVREMLRAGGRQSDLFALTMDDSLRGDVLPFSDPSGTSASAGFGGRASPSSGLAPLLPCVSPPSAPLSSAVSGFAAYASLSP